MKAIHTAGSGFLMTFANGWTISVQWGIGSYSDNRHYDDGNHSDEQNKKLRELGSDCAEVYIINPKKELAPVPGNFQDTCQGYATPDDIARLIHYTANL